MGSVLPKIKVDRIQWCEQHLATFAANAVAIGSSAAAVTDLSTKTIAARAAFDAQKTAQDAAKDATVTYQMALDAMTTAAADIIKSVKTKAATAGDGIYVLASIPVPATPSPKPPPGKPFEPVVTLSELGVLTLKWKCNNPAGTSGTIYQVWRQIGEAAAPVYLGGAGDKKFVDDSLPAGSTNVTYQVQGVRSTAIGEFATFNVRFGVSSGGAFSTVASVQETTAAKLAA